MAQTLSIGLIGAGRIGKLHAENIATRIPGARLGGVADINLAAARALATQWNVPRTTADYRELLEDRSLGAVVICSATDTHSRIVCEAAAAGKHIFCEKPIDFDLARISQTLAAVEKAGVKFQVGFNRRFDPGMAKARDLVTAGKVGRVHLLRITSRDPAPPPLEYIRVSGGIFLDMTIHDFDMVRFLSGSEAEEVFTMGATLVDPEIGRAGDVDTCLVTIRLRNGALATIDNSRKAAYGYDQRVEVFGSAGMVMVANRTPETHIHFTAEGVHSSTPLYFFPERYLESYVAEMREFVSAVEAGSTPPVTGRDGLAPVLMGLAAAKSLKEGRPVKLAEIG